MAGKRRERGEGGLYWDEARQRWVAEATVGYAANGRRIRLRGIGKTKTEAKASLKEKVDAYEAGLPADADHTTVNDAVTDWLAYGLNGRAARTVEKANILCRKHIVPHLGARKLKELTATDVDRWLAGRAKVLSSASLSQVNSCLNRAVRRAMARNLVARNVVELCDLPTGRPGRPSKSLAIEEAVALLKAAEGTPFYAYLVLSLLTGLRTEEIRALRWEQVDLVGRPDANPPIPPSVSVWRSVREHGDTKTKKSRRTLALPALAVYALKLHQEWQQGAKERAGNEWKATGLVFTSNVGTELDAANVRRSLRRTAKAAGLDPRRWTPRELRHSFVSIASALGLTIEQIVVKEYPKDKQWRQLRLADHLLDKLKDHIARLGIGADDLIFEMPRDREAAARRTVPAELPDPATLGHTQPNENGRSYQHGTTSAYNAGRCRCRHCRDAIAVYRASRRAAGKDAPRTPRTVDTDGHIPGDWFRATRWRKALATADIGVHITPHGLRHAHASWLLAGGADLLVVKERLGHGNIATTGRYLHTLPGGGDAALDAMAVIRGRATAAPAGAPIGPEPDVASMMAKLNDMYDLMKAGTSPAPVADAGSR